MFCYGSLVSCFNLLVLVEEEELNILNLQEPKKRKKGKTKKVQTKKKQKFDNHMENVTQCMCDVCVCVYVSNSPKHIRSLLSCTTISQPQQQPNKVNNNRNDGDNEITEILTRERIDRLLMFSFVYKSYTTMKEFCLFFMKDTESIKKLRKEENCQHEGSLLHTVY